MLKWTKEKPTKEGAYWRKNGYGPCIVGVWKQNTGRLVYAFTGDNNFCEVMLDDAEWAGPIPKPMEDAE